MCLLCTLLCKKLSLNINYAMYVKCVPQKWSINPSSNNGKVVQTFKLSSFLCLENIAK